MVQGPCILNGQEVYDALSDGQALIPNSRWIPIYVLLGIYGFWTLAYLAAVWIRGRQRSLKLSAALDRGVIAEQPVIIDNPLHSNQSYGSGVVNGIAARSDSPV